MQTSIKYFLSISLLFIIIASVAVPVLAQWQGELVCEVKDGTSEGDSDDEFKMGNEKEAYVSHSLLSLIAEASFLQGTDEKQHYKLDSLVSENHAGQLEMPPEA